MQEIPPLPPQLTQIPPPAPPTHKPTISVGGTKVAVIPTAAAVAVPGITAINESKSNLHKKREEAARIERAMNLIDEAKKKSQSQKEEYSKYLQWKVKKQRREIKLRQKEEDAQRAKLEKHLDQVLEEHLRQKKDFLKRFQGHMVKSPLSTMAMTISSATMTTSTEELPQSQLPLSQPISTFPPQQSPSTKKAIAAGVTTVPSRSKSVSVTIPSVTTKGSVAAVAKGMKVMITASAATAVGTSKKIQIPVSAAGPVTGTMGLHPRNTNSVKLALGAIPKSASTTHTKPLPSARTIAGRPIGAGYAPDDFSPAAVEDRKTVALFNEIKHHITYEEGTGFQDPPTGRTTASTTGAAAAYNITRNNNRRNVSSSPGTQGKSAKSLNRSGNYKAINASRGGGGDGNNKAEGTEVLKSAGTTLEELMEIVEQRRAAILAASAAGLSSSQIEKNKQATAAAAAAAAFDRNTYVAHMETVERMFQKARLRRDYASDRISEDPPADYYRFLPPIPPVSYAVSHGGTDEEGDVSRGDSFHNPSRQLSQSQTDPNLFLTAIGSSLAAYEYPYRNDSITSLPPDPFNFSERERLEQQMLQKQHNQPPVQRICEARRIGRRGKYHHFHWNRQNKDLLLSISATTAAVTGGGVTTTITSDQGEQDDFAESPIPTISPAKGITSAAGVDIPIAGMASEITTYSVDSSTLPTKPETHLSSSPSPFAMAHSDITTYSVETSEDEQDLMSTTSPTISTVELSLPPDTANVSPGAYTAKYSASSPSASPTFPNSPDVEPAPLVQSYIDHVERHTKIYVSPHHPHFHSSNPPPPGQAKAKVNSKWK